MVQESSRKTVEALEQMRQAARAAA